MLSPLTASATDDDRIEQAVVFRVTQPIAGKRPLFLLPREQDAAFLAQYGGPMDASVIEWAHSLMKPDATLIDVGSHVGSWSIPWALLGHPVFPFEPQQWLAKLCDAGFALNGLDTRTQRFGLSDEKRSASLKAPFPNGNGGSVLEPHPTHPNHEHAVQTEVELFRLDNVLTHKDNAIQVLLRIDVTGHELAVLRGAANTIRALKPKILFQCWDQEKGQDKEGLLRYLRDRLDYSPVKTSCHEVWIADPR